MGAKKEKKKIVAEPFTVTSKARRGSLHNYVTLEGGWVGSLETSRSVTGVGGWVGER